MMRLVLGFILSLFCVSQANALASPTCSILTNFASFTHPTPDFWLGQNPQTGTTYTVAAADNCSITTFSNASAIAVTLPQALNATATSSYTTAGVVSFFRGWTALYYNLGAGLVTITPTTSTINGASSFTLSQGQGAIITNINGNYIALRTGTPVVGQTLGTATNDNASAGNVGEYITSSIASGSAVSLTNGTPANMTSASLTAGDWDVSCTLMYSGTATTSVNYLTGSLSTTSATLNTTPGFITGRFAGIATIFNVGAAAITELVGPARFSLSGTTTVYCVAQSGFTASTEAVFGLLRARRVR